MKKFYVLTLIFLLVLLNNLYSMKYEHEIFTSAKIHMDLVMSRAEMKFNGVNEWQCLSSEFIGIAIKDIKSSGILNFKKYTVIAKFQALDNYNATNQKGEATRMLITGDIRLNYEKDNLISVQFITQPKKYNLNKETHEHFVKIGTTYAMFQSEFREFKNKKFDIIKHFDLTTSKSYYNRSEMIKFLDECYNDKHTRFKILNSFIPFEDYNLGNDIQLISDYRPINNSKTDIGFLYFINFIISGDNVKIASFVTEWQSDGN